METRRPALGRSTWHPAAAPRPAPDETTAKVIRDLFSSFGPFRYGAERTLRADVVEVVHHTGKHGQRYQVDKSHAQLLQGLLRAGEARIGQHLQSAGAPLGAPPPGFSRFQFMGGRGGGRGPRPGARRRPPGGGRFG